MPELFAVLTITVLAVLSPGPDFAMVSRNSLLQSRRAGVLTALGIGLGVLVHVSYTLIGMDWVLRQAPWLLQTLRWAGAGYLIWLGLGMLRAQPQALPDDAAAPAMSDLHALRTGFLTNALNPKTSVFVVSLFAQVVGPMTPWAVQLAYGLFIAAAHWIWFGTVALFLSAPAVRERLGQVRHWIDRSFGAVLLMLGVLLAVQLR